MTRDCSRAEITRGCSRARADLARCSPKPARTAREKRRAPQPAGRRMPTGGPPSPIHTAAGVERRRSQAHAVGRAAAASAAAMALRRSASACSSRLPDRSGASEPTEPSDRRPNDMEQEETLLHVAERGGGGGSPAVSGAYMYGTSMAPPGSSASRGRGGGIAGGVVGGTGAGGASRKASPVALPDITSVRSGEGRHHASCPASAGSETECAAGSSLDSRQEDAPAALGMPEERIQLASSLRAFHA